MNFLLKSIVMLCLLVIQACSGGDNPFVPDGGSSSSGTNIIAENKFTIASGNINPAFIIVTYGDGTETPAVPTTTIKSIDSTTIGGTLTISAYSADRAGFKTAGNPITFAANYGSIEQSCTIEDGTCSVEFTTLGTLPNITTATINGVADTQSIFANFIIYTLGEEPFLDVNGNGFFDDGDTFTFTQVDPTDPNFPIAIDDVEEPYLDNNNNGFFDTGDVPIDIDGNGIHTVGDGKYNGSNCQHSTLCAASSSTVIWDSVQIDLIN